jgi:hypothetical protein
LKGRSVSLPIVSNAVGQRVTFGLTTPASVCGAMKRGYATAGKVFVNAGSSRLGKARDKDEAFVVRVLDGTTTTSSTSSTSSTTTNCERH